MNIFNIEFVCFPSMTQVIVLRCICFVWHTCVFSMLSTKCLFAAILRALFCKFSQVKHTHQLKTTLLLHSLTSLSSFALWVGNCQPPPSTSDFMMLLLFVPMLLAFNFTFGFASSHPLCFALHSCWGPALTTGFLTLPPFVSNLPASKSTFGVAFTSIKLS